MGLVSCLAASTSTSAAIFVMPSQASEIGTLPPMEKKKNVVDLKVMKINIQELKMPAALPRVFRKLGRKKTRGEGEAADAGVELLQLSSVKGKSGLVSKGGGWTIDKQDAWVLEEGGGKEADLAREGDHVLVEGYRGRDGEDSIGFITTEERFENVDVKK